MWHSALRLVQSDQDARLCVGVLSERACVEQLERASASETATVAWLPGDEKFGIM
jgi:hypothetical protein